MGYSIPLQTRVDLSDLGTDNQGNPFFANIKLLNALPFERKMEFIEKVQGLFGGATVAEGQVQMSSLDISAMKSLKEAVHPLIVSWNLIDFNEQPVNVEDKDALDRVPSIVVERINKEISKGASGRSEETKNSSEQSAKS